MDPKKLVNPVQQNPSEAIKFVDELIDQKFAGQKEQLTPEVRDELRKDLLVRLDEFVMAKVIAELSDEDLQKFEDLMKEGKTREDMQQFATEHIPDFVDFATNAFLEFRTVYLGKTE